jgi:hypothetical protein
MTRLTREMETRSQEMLPAYSMRYKSSLSIPPGVAKEGYTYYWAQYALRGEPTYQVEDLAGRGWSLVPADRAKIKSTDLLGRNPLSQKYICVKDLILMECPSEVANYYLEQNRKFNESRVKGMRHVTTDNIRFSRY